MKFLIYFCAVLMLGGCATATDKNTKLGSVFDIKSPDGNITAQFSAVGGAPTYKVTFSGKPVINASALGANLDGFDFSDALSLVAVSDTRIVEDQYEMRQGKQKKITYTANEQVFTLKNIAQQTIAIRFRVSNDGVAFRYEFSGDTEDKITLQQELTRFAFPSSTHAWLQPVAVAQTGWKNTNPSYEEHYQMDIPVGTELPSPAGWVFPALFKTGDVWVVLTEAGMDGQYHGSRLQAQSTNGEYRIDYPMAAEVFTDGALMANAKLPFNSPWRIIAVGDLATITQSTLGTDLAFPAIDPMAFVKPGTASWSWALLKDDSVNYETQIEFIDYAADMGWPYTLVDADWDRRIGAEKVQQLAKYAATKNVGLLLWYNSSGDWNETTYSPKSQLLTESARRKEFAKLQSWGIKGVKIDFFSGDGQSMMAYYQALAKDAADFNLIVNYHGSSLPRGLQRTYPNLMTMESVHGFEMITFTQHSADLAASHMAVLPFTRNLFDPMDFTPTTFGDIPNIERKTTNGFELALPVLFLSGVQHIAETAEGMSKAPAFVKEVMRKIPVLWDESRLVDGYPGKHAIIARRAGDVWYVAGINGENKPKQFRLDLSFIKNTRGSLISDGDEKYRFKQKNIQPSQAFNIDVKANGGFLMVFAD